MRIVWPSASHFFLPSSELQAASIPWPWMASSVFWRKIIHRSQKVYTFARHNLTLFVIWTQKPTNRKFIFLRPYLKWWLEYASKVNTCTDNHMLSDADSVKGSQPIRLKDVKAKSNKPTNRQRKTPSHKNPIWKTHIRQRAGRGSKDIM